MDLLYLTEAADFYDTSTAWLTRRYHDLLDYTEPDGECLIYQGYTNQHGYGSATVAGKRVYVHRFFLALTKGPPTDEAPFAVRTCRNRACCNPAHLYWAPKSGRLDHRIHARAKTNRKLSDDDVRDIRRRWAEGTPQARLAEEYEVSGTSIWSVVHGRTYKDIE